MIIKILPAQIPVFWETIKFCETQVNEVSSDIRQLYLNNLLHSLLSDKAQCFVRLDEKRVLIALMITKIEKNKITLDNYLHIQTLYSFRKVPDRDWEVEYEFIRQFAEKAKCKSITFDTCTEKIMQLGQLVGFKEVHRSFELNLEGVYHG